MFKKILKPTVASLMLWSQLQAQCFESECQPCNPFDTCGCDSSFYVGAEYLYWKINNSPKSIPLVLSSDTFEATLDSPGSTVVLGDRSVNSNWQSGGRFTLGYVLDRLNKVGFEANYFFLGNQSKTKIVASSGLTGSPFLSVPYFNVTTLSESSFGISNSDPDIDQGPFAGFASFKVSSWMQGAELNAFSALPISNSYNFGLLLGFRYLNFHEKATFYVNSPYLEFPDDIFLTTDHFNADNNFYGGQIGIQFDYACNCFYLNVEGKVALGANCASVDIHGDFQTNEFISDANAGPAQTFNGGIFALGTNIGDHDRTYFSVLPEVNINLGYNVTKSLKVQLGYTFFYLSNVLRASNQLDRNLNPTQSAAISFTPTPVLVGEPSPVAFHNTQGLWVHGLNVGLAYVF